MCASIFRVYIYIYIISKKKLLTAEVGLFEKLASWLDKDWFAEPGASISTISTLKGLAGPFPEALFGLKGSEAKAGGGP